MRSRYLFTLSQNKSRVENHATGGFVDLLRCMCENCLSACADICGGDSDSRRYLALMFFVCLHFVCFVLYEMVLSSILCLLVSFFVHWPICWFVDLMSFWVMEGGRVRVAVWLLWAAVGRMQATGPRKCPCSLVSVTGWNLVASRQF